VRAVVRHLVVATFRGFGERCCLAAWKTERWLPPSKQALVDELVEAIEARQSAILTGEPGVGKTCVLRVLRHVLPSERYR
jgi:type II secretory pathway predicted ATPase ExeA